jgi:hypothetical protein
VNDNLPVDYRDYPKAYIGQPKRAPAEEYGDFPDRSKPDAPAARQDADDALDANRPSGMRTAPIKTKKKKIVWRARAH